MTEAATPEGRDTHHDDFRLSITKAFSDQMAAALSQLTPVGLTPENLVTIDERAGVYQLYLHDELVYVGKADKSLRQRLGDHMRKLGGRRNLELTDIRFTCLYVEEDFTAVAPEKLLISHYQGLGGIPWNNGGFGGKDPGRQRDTTTSKANHFDVLHPIDLDRRIRDIPSGEMPLDAFLKRVKSAVPFIFRYGSVAKVGRTPINVTEPPRTADEAFRLVSGALPDSWQITALLGYVVMYDETKEYPSAWRYYRSGEVTEANPESDPVDDPAALSLNEDDEQDGIEE